MRRVKNMLLNNQEITEEIKEEIKKYLEASSKREVYSNTILPQETRKISNKQPNLTPKAITQRRTKSLQSEQKERNHKDQIGNK